MIRQIEKLLVWDSSLPTTPKAIALSVLGNIQNSDRAENHKYDRGADHHHDLDFGIRRVLCVSIKILRGGSGAAESQLTFLVICGPVNDPVVEPMSRIALVRTFFVWP